MNDSKTTKRKNRHQIIKEIKANLLHNSLPRISMTLMILLTGFAGFLSSFVMLHFGLTKMWLRYSLAVLVSYAVFLLLLKFWLWTHQPKGRIDIGDDFGGLDFGNPSSSSDISSVGDFGFDMDLDDGVVLILVLAILVIALFALVYVIYIAPVLLAEILVDGLAVSSLSLGLKDTDRQYWLSSVLKKTWIPLMIIITLFIIAGATLQTIYPEANSIRECWNAYKSVN